MKKGIFLIIGACLIAGFLIVKQIQSRGSINTENEPSQIPAKNVSLYSVEKKTIQDIFTTQANLLPIREVTLKPPNNTTIREVLVKSGQRVFKNQILILINSELQQLRAQLDRLEMKTKSYDYKLTRTLASKNYISGVEYKQKSLEYESLKIRQRINELESAREMKSPIQGVVAEINMKQGDYVDNNNFSLRVIDNSQFKINLFVPYSVAARIKPGTRAELIRTDTHVHGHAQVSAVSPIVDSKTGSVFVELIVEKIPPQWLAGMFVEIRLILNEVTGAISIPRQALIFDQGKTYVFKYKETDDAGRAVKQLVSTGITDGNNLEVKEGLTELDLIIVEGQNQIKHDDLIQVSQ